jgi:RimJ/RimL family protein N-acetyltransferase
MEKMPYQPHLDSSKSDPDSLTTDVSWRGGLPTLQRAIVTLRDLRPSDAPSLFASITAQDVERFISPPPATIEGFEKFIAWTHQQRTAGQHLTFAAVAPGTDDAVGIFQIRSLEPDFSTAEWGFALGVEYWGRGMFTAGAELVIDFAFDVLGARRLEARAAVQNTRGNAALKKLGATEEVVLRQSFQRNGEYLDQALWSIIVEDWRAKAAWGVQVH